MDLSKNKEATINFRLLEAIERNDIPTFISLVEENEGIF